MAEQHGFRFLVSFSGLWQKGSSETQKKSSRSSEEVLKFLFETNMATLPLPFDEYFHLDTENECIWHGERAVQLTPKAFALLRYLVERPGQLVTKEELLNAIWPETIVGEGVLTTHVRAIRQALGDNAKSPRYVETVHRRGYRFIEKVVSSQHSVVSSQESVPTPSPQSPAPNLVGREAELTQLHELFAKAVNGERLLVFITGEPGIGKDRKSVV